jgi:hypothetical protein
MRAHRQIKLDGQRTALLQGFVLRRPVKPTVLSKSRFLPVHTNAHARVRWPAWIYQ